MKMWIYRTKKIIRSQKGETLMESVVSLFIFTLLMLAVTTMIQTSLKMTGIFTEEARAAQDEFNSMVLSNPGGGATADITINAADIGVSVADTVIIHKSGDIIAFVPPEPDPGDEP